jgi:biopolymer transport protein ExbB/TolQ
MLLFFLIGFIAWIAVGIACYAVYGFMEAMTREVQKLHQQKEELEQEQAKLRFENKRKQLIINQLEADKEAIENEV